MGRPKGSKKTTSAVRPTCASPEGRPLSRDASKANEDATEDSVYSNKSTVSNSLGGCDLRVLRDNLAEMTRKNPQASGKRDASDLSSSNGATYAANKGARARKRLDQIKKELEAAEEKQSGSGADMMQMLLFMREDADRRLEIEERRRREDREIRLASEKIERENRESTRREEAAAAEARRTHELEMAHAIREDQLRKDAAIAAENKLIHEERLERERAEARERHEQNDVANREHPAPESTTALNYIYES